MYVDYSYSNKGAFSIKFVNTNALIVFKILKITQMVINGMSYIYTVDL